jgi:uncharacterized protein YukE
MSTTISVAAFKVDLQGLADAISSIKSDAASIYDSVGSIDALLQHAETLWVSPGGTTFADLYPQLADEMASLVGILYEMVQRMQAAYDNYNSIELDNVASLIFG